MGRTALLDEDLFSISSILKSIESILASNSDLEHFWERLFSDVEFLDASLCTFSGLAGIIESKPERANARRMIESLRLRFLAIVEGISIALSKEKGDWSNTLDYFRQVQSRHVQAEPAKNPADIGKKSAEAAFVSEMELELLLHE